MYRVASFLLQQSDWWGNFSKMADALSVLLLTWNASFFRYNGGWVDGDRLESCLQKHWKSIAEFHGRDILDFKREDEPSVRAAFNDLLRALQIETTKTKKIRQSPVGVAKALHLLAPSFFPIWDYEIANRYGCRYSARPADSYLSFCGKIRKVAEELEESPADPERSLVKRIDEYNYARFSKGWIKV